jgi:hypothetical protein
VGVFINCRVGKYSLEESRLVIQVCAILSLESNVSLNVRAMPAYAVAICASAAKQTRLV